MNIAEAHEVLSQELARYRELTYEQLCALVDAGVVVIEREGPSGSHYQIEVHAMWDSKPNGEVRVLASIDDGGWRAFVPMCEDFIKSPDGSFSGGDHER